MTERQRALEPPLAFLQIVFVMAKVAWNFAICSCVYCIRDPLRRRRDVIERGWRRGPAVCRINVGWSRLKERVLQPFWQTSHGSS